MRSGIILLAAVTSVLFVLPAFADDSSNTINIVGGSEAGQACVASKTCYEPGVETVKPRTLVMWTNQDTTAHTVTSGDPSGNQTGALFDSSQISPGGTFSFIFMTPGTFDYFCSIHPWMTGQVMVSGAPSPGATTPEFGPVAGAVLAGSIFLATFLARGQSFKKYL